MTQKKYTTIHGIDEVMNRLNKGLGVQGKLYIDKQTGTLSFQPHKLAKYIDGYRKAPDRLLIETAYGKVLASSERYKFHNSVKNSKGAVWAAEQMLKDCTEAMEKLKQLGKDAELIDKI
jgi:hypothetical protein